MFNPLGLSDQFLSLLLPCFGLIHNGCVCILLSSSASKSKPASSTPDVPGDRENDKTPQATKHQDATPTTPTKTEKEKKEKTSKKKEKSKGAPVLPPVEAKPPPGPLVALGRRDKPQKRPRSVERWDTFSLSLSLTVVQGLLALHQVLCHVYTLNILLYTSRLDHGITLWIYIKLLVQYHKQYCT